MKKSALVGLVVAALLAAPAFAADLPVKAPTAIAAPVWTGFYVGASLGARYSNTTWTSVCAGDPCDPANLANPGNPASFSSDTIRVGGYLGYNWVFAPQWLIGIEGDFAWGDSNRTLDGIPGLSLAPDSTTVKQGWDASVRARLGFLVTPSMLLYATGGGAWQQVKISATCVNGTTNPSPSGWCDDFADRSETFSSVRTGWTLGGGLEAMLWPNWLGRIEYRYADYGTIDHTFFNTTSLCTSSPGTLCDRFNMNQSLKTNTVLVGLAYKF